MKLRLYLVELTVSDLARAVSWYSLWFDDSPKLTDATFALFDAGDCRLALKQGEPQPGTTHCTFETTALDVELQRLATVGIVTEGPLKSSHEGYRRARFRDPDGNGLCLFEWEGK